MSKSIKTHNTLMAAVAEDVIDDAELESILATVTVDGVDDEEIVEEVAEAAADATDEEIEEIIAALEIEEAKAEAYAEQEPGADMVIEEAAAESNEGGKPAKKAKAPRAYRKTMAGYKKSEVIMDRLGANSHEYFALELADAELSQEELKAKQEEMLARIDGIAKKIGEKAVNLLSWLAGRAKLSNYTEQALRLLIEKGKITSKDLLEHYKARPYSEGTSRSQSQQLMKLLPEMKVGIMDGKVMHLNPESLIVAKFREQIEG